MNENIPDLDPGDLRKFGLTAGGFIAVILGLALPWLYGHPRPLWPWIVGAVLVLWSLILPANLRLVYRGWMRFALIVGKVNSYLLLSIIFIFVFSLAGIVMRLFGYDPLHRTFLTHAGSYRKPSITKKRDHMEEPY